MGDSGGNCSRLGSETTKQKHHKNPYIGTRNTHTEPKTPKVWNQTPPNVGPYLADSVSAAQGKRAYMYIIPPPFISDTNLRAYPPILISEPSVGRGFTMFVIWYRREGFTMFIILLLISQTETKKQLIVWRHDRMQYPLKLSSGFCCELAFVCPGRWSLRLAPLTVNALGLSTPSSYERTLRR